MGSHTPAVLLCASDSGLSESTLEDPFLRAENNEPIFVTEDLLESVWEGAGLPSEGIGLGTATLISIGLGVALISTGLGVALSSTVLAIGLGVALSSTVLAIGLGTAFSFGSSSKDSGCITF